MKNLARILTRSGPSAFFWLFVYCAWKFQTTFYPEPTTMEIVVGMVLLLISSMVVSVVESLIYLWSSK